MNEIVNDTGVTKPSEILQSLKEGVIKALKQTGDAGTQKDGMDAALIAWDKGSTLQVAAAYNPLLIISDDKLDYIIWRNFSVC